MRINILRAILIILLISILGVIFSFSNQNGERSSGISRKITEIITQNIKWVQNLEKNKKEQTLKKIEHIVRKLAHFSLYTAVGILTMGLMSTYKLKQNIRILVSLGIGMLYAISDEFHQLFIAGRAASLGDVMIDTSGVIFGIAVVLVAVKLVIPKVITKKKELR